MTSRTTFGVGMLHPDFFIFFSKVAAKKIY